jgi:hypothetical protein
LALGWEIVVSPPFSRGEIESQSSSCGFSKEQAENMPEVSLSPATLPVAHGRSNLNATNDLF